MVSTLSHPLSLFPQEAAIIGSLVVGYGEIEYDLATCVEAVVGVGEPSRGFKAMYCSKGEDGRLKLADVLCRSSFAERGLGDGFAETLHGVRHCKKIRNQYAHSNWTTAKSAVGEIHEWSEGGLRLVLLEESARKAGPMIFELRTITLKLLNEQDAYFRNVRDWLIYLQVAYRAGGASSGRGLKPQRLGKPARYLVPAQLPTPV